MLLKSDEMRSIGQLSGGSIGVDRFFISFRGIGFQCIDDIRGCRRFSLIGALDKCLVCERDQAALILSSPKICFEYGDESLRFLIVFVLLGFLLIAKLIQGRCLIVNDIGSSGLRLAFCLS